MAKKLKDYNEKDFLNSIITAYNYGRKYGLTKKGVAKIYGVSENAVEKVLNAAKRDEYELFSRHREVFSKRIYAEDIAKIASQYNKGMALKEIAQYHTLSISSIYRSLHKADSVQWRRQRVQSYRAPPFKFLEGRVKSVENKVEEKLLRTPEQQRNLRRLRPWYKHLLKCGAYLSLASILLFPSISKAPENYFVKGNREIIEVAKPPTKQTKMQVKSYPDKNSIVDYLKSQKVRSDIGFRDKLYHEIFGADASYPHLNNAKQNTELWKALKQNPSLLTNYLAQSRTQAPQVMEKEAQAGKEQQATLQQPKQILEDIASTGPTEVEKIEPRETETIKKTEWQLRADEVDKKLKVLEGKYPGINKSGGGVWGGADYYRKYKELVAEKQQYVVWDKKAQAQEGEVKEAGEGKGKRLEAKVEAGSELESLNKVPFIGVLVPDPEHVYTAEQLKNNPVKTFFNENLSDKRPELPLDYVPRTITRGGYKLFKKVPLLNWLFKTADDFIGNIADKVVIIGKDGNEIVKDMVTHPVKTLKEKPLQVLEVGIVNYGFYKGVKALTESAPTKAAPVVVEEAPGSSGGSY